MITMVFGLTRVLLVSLMACLVCCKAETNSNDNSVLHFETSQSASFQGCLLSCLDKDFCCSCKESGKLPMNAAMINELIKTCANEEVLQCSKIWVDSWINDDRGGASDCITQDDVDKELGRCISTCKGRPLSKPLNIYHPEHYPGPLIESSDLLEYPNPDFSEFCSDMRAGNILCTVYRSCSYTAGNTLCRHGNVCGFQGYAYSWCYVDFGGNWDYCCTGSCDFHHSSYEWCKSGTTWQYCGKGGNRDIQGRRCTREYPCGMHQEIGKASYYWCYVDAQKHWDRCCEPWDKCRSKGQYYDECYTGYKRDTQQKKCRKLD